MSGDQNGVVQIHWLCLHFPTRQHWSQQGGCVTLMWCVGLCSGLAVLSCGWAELWRILERFLACWIWWLFVCVKLAGVGSWVCWKGREPSWKTGVITQLSGKGSVELNLLFGLAHYLRKPKSVLQPLSIRQQLSQQTLHHIASNCITATAANNF